MLDVDKMQELANELFEVARNENAVLALTYFKDGEGFVTFNGTGNDLIHAVYVLVDHMRAHNVTSREY